MAPAAPSRPRRRRLLELFKGTGSVGRVFEANGFEVVSLDLEAKWEPTIVADICRWDYRAAFRPGHFHTIWCSPPCTEFSIALTTRPRDLRLGNRIVRRTLEIVRYLRPRFWYLENPATGLLKRQAQMRHLPFVDLDYCCFSDWGYRKPTRMWYGGSGWRTAEGRKRRLADRRCDMRTCPNLAADGRHRVHLSGNTGREGASRHRKYRVPARLVAYVAGLRNVPED